MRKCRCKAMYNRFDNLIKLHSLVLWTRHFDAKLWCDGLTPFLICDAVAVRTDRGRGIAARDATSGRARDEQAARQLLFVVCIY